MSSTGKEESADSARRNDEARTAMKPGDEAPPGTPGTGENLCPTCSGSGRTDDRPCPDCEGTGRVVTGIGGA